MLMMTLKVLEEARSLLQLIMTGRKACDIYYPSQTTYLSTCLLHNLSLGKETTVPKPL